MLEELERLKKELEDKEYNELMNKNKNLINKKKYWNILKMSQLIDELSI